MHERPWPPFVTSPCFLNCCGSIVSVRVVWNFRSMYWDLPRCMPRAPSGGELSCSYQLKSNLNTFKLNHCVPINPWQGLHFLKIKLGLSGSILYYKKFNLHSWTITKVHFLTFKTTKPDRKGPRRLTPTDTLQDLFDWWLLARKQIRKKERKKEKLFTRWQCS